VSPSYLVSWSVGIQLGAAVLIALFFAVLARAVRNREAKLWALAWLAETLAIAFVLVTLYLVQNAPGDPIFRIPLAAFCTFKTLFAALFVLGIRRHFLPRLDPAWSLGILIGVAVAWGAILATLTPSPVEVLPFQWLVVGGLLIFGGTSALRGMEGRARWLGWILLGEGILFLGYVPLQAPVLWGETPLFNLQSYSSLFDAGADLLLALATLVALESSSSRHQERLNAELQRSYERLRHLAENDPLTGLINRRGSEPVLEAAQHTGAALIFMDIDGFKRINDRHGHSAGDACLVHLAEVLRTSFRPSDQHVRWGGDEFLAVAPGLTLEAARERVTEVRQALGETLVGTDVVPAFSVSVGVALLEPGGDPEAALREADRGMYLDKRRLAVRLRI